MSKILLTDDELVHRIKEGSNPAFEIVFKKYYSELFCFACTYIMNKQQAEDLVQEVFVSVWSNRDKLPKEVKLKYYLYTSVKHRCYDIFRRFNVEDRHKEKLVEALRYSGLDDEYEGCEMGSFGVMSETIAALPERQKNIIEMRYLKGQSYKQIAVDIGVTENTVHTHIKRAYNSLRKMFSFILLGI